MNAQRNTNDLSEKHKEAIRQMNLSYLFLARDLAKESIPKACVLLGLSRNEVIIIRDCPVKHLSDVVSFPSILFNFRKNNEFWILLKKGTTPNWEKLMLSKMLSEELQE